jgi:hypothetical protein
MSKKAELTKDEISGEWQASELQFNGHMIQFNHHNTDLYVRIRCKTEYSWEGLMANNRGYYSNDHRRNYFLILKSIIEYENEEYNGLQRRMNEQTRKTQEENEKMQKELELSSGGINEILQETRNLVTRTKEVQEWTERILKLVKGDEEKEEKRILGIEGVESIKRLEKIYEEILRIKILLE